MTCASCCGAPGWPEQGPPRTSGVRVGGSARTLKKQRAGGRAAGERPGSAGRRDVRALPPRAAPGGRRRALAPAVLGGVRHRGRVLEDQALVDPCELRVDLLDACELARIERLPRLQPDLDALPARAQGYHEGVALDRQARGAVDERGRLAEEAGLVAPGHVVVDE